ncbi:hypothetical protein J6590_091770 [Homalodisca vitripennis]|nr:hypothetical protein J6590_091770 [Homalodisca vitripennis]
MQEVIGLMKNDTICIQLLIHWLKLVRQQFSPTDDTYLMISGKTVSELRTSSQGGLHSEAALKSRKSAILCSAFYNIALMDQWCVRDPTEKVGGLVPVK